MQKAFISRLAAKNRLQTYLAFLAAIGMLLTSCSYNPLSANNHLTGSPVGTLVGAGAGAGGVALLGGTKPYILAGGLIGGAIGYYVTTLRYDAGGLVSSCGQVYVVGKYVGIYIPTDKIFEPNTADFTPQAEPILDSAVAVLQRYPDNNILISGNTSGFGRPRWEQKLSEERASKIAGYLWNAGISNFKDCSNDTSRKLTYTGYGNFFPISSDLSNCRIRQNSRIQITAYPPKSELQMDACHDVFKNYGAWDDDNKPRSKCASCNSDCSPREPLA